MPRLVCTSLRADGGACQAPPRPSGKCLFHDPATAETAAEGRRRGGLGRRRVEATLAGLYGIDGLETPAQRMRVLTATMFDTLALPNSIGRSRTQVAIVLAAERIDKGIELEARIAALEAALGANHRPPVTGTSDPLEEEPDDQERQATWPARSVPFGARGRPGRAR
jgi:hypothetical protein